MRSMNSLKVKRYSKNRKVTKSFSLFHFICFQHVNKQKISATPRPTFQNRTNFSKKFRKLIFSIFFKNTAIVTRIAQSKQRIISSAARCTRKQRFHRNISSRLFLQKTTASILCSISLIIMITLIENFTNSKEKSPMKMLFFCEKFSN